MKEQIISVLTVTASVAYCFPLILLLYKRLWNTISLRVFCLYWVMGSLINILSIVPVIAPRTLEVIHVVYNLIDIPLILSLLFLTTKARIIQIFIVSSGMVYMFLQTAAIYKAGWFYDSMKYTLGLGLGLVITVLVWEILRFFQRLHHSPHQKRMLFIYIALLFEYGTFVVVYIFDYFYNGSENPDTLFLYYFTSLLAMLIVSTGLMLKLKAPKGHLYPSITRR